MQAGIVIYNPDNPGRAVNSPNAVYQVEPTTLSLLRSFGTSRWSGKLKKYLKNKETLVARNAKEREQKLVPVQIDQSRAFSLSPGKHSELIKAIIDDFAPRFVPSSILVYAGDTGDKWGYFDESLFAELGINIDSHGKMPDVVLFNRKKHWLVLAESVTSHGPVNSKRYEELKQLFSVPGLGLIYVTAFPDRPTMRKYLSDIAWETEVWVADSPSHLIHFDGEKFLGPNE
jgi:type II restriction enzyme